MAHRYVSMMRMHEVAHKVLEILCKRHLNDTLMTKTDAENVLFRPNGT